MKTELIKIGNSQGLRIPKLLLEQCGLKGSVNLEVKGHSLVISPELSIREGWDKAFQKMAKNADDTPLMNEAEPNSFDEEEWSW